MKRGPFILLIVLFLHQAASAQVKITSLELHTKEGKHLYSFPLIHSENKAVAYKINNYLQSNLLGNDSLLTDTNTIFKEARFISYINEDSVGQSGYTDINYEVEINNSDILSISFFIETMGAYPETHWNYLNFDSQTGETLEAKDLLTPAGITTLKSILLKKRKKIIDDWINEMDTADIKDDAEWIRETFNKCNAEANENDFIIKNYGIIFWKEVCFPHAWRPYDTDLDIEFSYKELEKFLSRNGKSLLNPKKK